MLDRLSTTWAVGRCCRFDDSYKLRGFCCFSYTVDVHVCCGWCACVKYAGITQVLCWNLRFNDVWSSLIDFICTSSLILMIRDVMSLPTYLPNQVLTVQSNNTKNLPISKKFPGSFRSWLLKILKSAYQLSYTTEPLHFLPINMGGVQNSTPTRIINLLWKRKLEPQEVLIKPNKTCVIVVAIRFVRSVSQLSSRTSVPNPEQ